MTTYNWKILDLSRIVLNGFVTKVRYEVIATDGEYLASVQDVVTYDQATSASKISETPGAQFMPFDQLTENLVIEWVKETVTQYGVASIEASLAQMIEEKKHPKIVNGLPWAQNLA
jgi:sporulation protein YlmC with PRC-barrel domain